MNKRIITIFLVVTMILSVFSTSAFSGALYTDIPNGSNYEKAVNDLTQMKVVEGYGNGQFKPNNNITRSQFIKMMVVALGKDDDAQASQGSTIFSDIPSDFWANGYINVAVKNNIIMGYSDGTFRPDENINFSQVVTIILRVLGYGTAQMSGVWPQNYIDLAKSLGITEGISMQPTSLVNRANTALMLDRAINTDMQASTKTLAEQSGLGTVKTVIITNSSDIDNTLSFGIVQTDSGNYISSSFKGIENLGKKVTILADTNNNLLSIQKVQEDSRILFVNSISGSTVSYTDKKGSGTIDLPDNLTIYYNGQKTTFSNVKQNVSTASIIALASTDLNSQSYDYGVLLNPITTQPTVAQNDVQVGDKNIGPIDISNRDAFSVIKNGEKASFSDIKMYDVVYQVTNPFSSQSGLLLVYDNKVTGTYDTAIPSKNAVSQITVLEKQYNIETSKAASKLNDSSNAYNIGDEITLLTGKTGKIVDVVTPGMSDNANYAIVVNYRQSMLTPSNTNNNTFYYAKLYTVDGNVVEYRTDSDQSGNKGKLVRYFVKDNIAYINTTSSIIVGGSVDRFNKTIGDYWFSDNAVILDENLNVGDQDDVTVNKIDMSEMPTYVAPNKVMNTVTGGPFNDVQLLVTNNLIDPGQYGILTNQSTKLTGSITNATYTIMINGKPQTYNYTFTNNNASFGVMQGDVVYVNSNMNMLQGLTTLMPAEKGTEIQGIDMRRVKVNNHIYRLASDVQIFDVTGGTPVQTSIWSITPGKVDYVAIYMGNQTNNNNLVKVITFIKNK